MALAVVVRGAAEAPEADEATGAPLMWSREVVGRPLSSLEGRLGGGAVESFEGGAGGLLLSLGFGVALGGGGFGLRLPGYRLAGGGGP